MRSIIVGTGETNFKDFPHLPLSEEHLLAWIDGEVSPEQAAGFAAASGRPDLPERVAQMQRHRALLRGLPIEQAPGDLMERVLAALERDALLNTSGAGADDGSSILDDPGEYSGVIGTITPQDAPTREWVSPELQAHRELTDFTPAPVVKRRERSRFPMALAAGLACAAAAGLYFLPRLRLGSAGGAGSGAGGGPIAKAERADQIDALATGPDAQRAANGAIKAAETLSASAPARGGLALEPLGDESPAVLAAAPSVSPLAGEEIERVLQLAREHRLVIRVLAQETRNLPRLAEEVGLPTTQRTWSMSSNVPPAVVAAMLSASTPPGHTPPPAGGGTRVADARRATENPENNPPVMFASNAPRTGAALLGALAGPRSAMTFSVPLPTEPASRVRGTYVLHAPCSASALEAFKAVVQSQLRARVVFEESAQALSVPCQAAPEQVLWWTRPSAEWTSRASVPVIVEQR